MLYFDASALVPIIVKEPATAAISGVLLAPGQELAVSDFAAAELASALSRLVRMARMDAAAALSRLEDFDIWRAAATTPVELSPADMRLATIFVRRFDLKLRAPDALHLAVCRRLGLTLITLDQRLADAAKSLTIEVRVPASVQSLGEM